MSVVIPSREIFLPASQVGCADGLKIRIHSCPYCETCSPYSSVIKSHIQTQHPDGGQLRALPADLGPAAAAPAPAPGPAGPVDEAAAEEPVAGPSAQPGPLDLPADLPADLPTTETRAPTPPPPPSQPPAGRAGLLISTENGGREEEGGPLDIRLKEHFKMCLLGASGSGKTDFCFHLLSNLSTFTKNPPKKVFFVFAVWQNVYSQMKDKGLVDIFIEVKSGSLEEVIRKHLCQNVLIVFDDCFTSGSENLKFIAALFLVTGRHMGASLVYVGQHLFAADESLRHITNNCDYLVMFKSIRSQNDIRHLASQMFPNRHNILTSIFAAATDQPYSYLFIDLTQTADERARFLSNIWDKDGIISTYIPTTADT